MLSESPKGFNSIADTLLPKARTTLMESLWAGAGGIFDEASGKQISVVPDRAAQDGELLFYVGFPGSKRDRIPTQHYFVGAPDVRTAAGRAHELYVLQPRHRNGASLRLMIRRPPDSAP